MKTKKTLGIFAMALTALTCAFPSTAKAAGGDIRSITVYQDAETAERTFPNEKAPLVAGETVKFKIRLLNRGMTVEKLNTDPTYTNPWTLQHVGGNDPIADTNNMPQVGLWISGQRKYAKIESWKLADQYFTDMICSYTVQPGDLAMPLKLVAPDGKGEAMEVTTGSWYSQDYYVKDSDLWNFFPQANEGNSTSNKLEFYFGPTSLNGLGIHQLVVSADLASSVRDYNLANAGIFIQAVDFDDATTEDPAIWRSIAASSSTATPALPRLSIPKGSADSQTLYVWTKDPTVAEVDNGATDQTYVFGDGVTRKVSKITIKPGDELVPFKIRGIKEGFSTEVYMAATPTNVYNNAHTLVTNFTTRTVFVTEALPPGMTVEIDQDVVKTSSDYKLSVAAINVTLTQPYTEDLTVTLKPTMKDESGIDPFKYIGLSSLADGKEEYSKQEVTITIPKGRTSADGLIYLYANRADEHTLKGIRFDVDQTKLSAEEKAFFTGAFSPDTIEIDYDGGALQILTPVEGAAYQHVPGNVLHDFEVTIADAIGELNDGTYTVYWDNNGSGSATAVSGLKADAKGKLVVPRTYVTAMTYNSQFWVVNEGGAKSDIRHVTVQVDAPKTISATLDKGVANYKEGETAKVTLDFSDTFQESSNPGYIFLIPLDETTKNLVEITSQDEANHTTSVLVYPGFSTANSQASIRLKDGYNGCTLSFGVEVRDANDNTQNNVITAWVGKQFFVGVDNVAPTVSYIEMNDTPLKTNGGTFTSKVPIGVQKVFSVGVSDPGINYFDFENGDVAYTQIKFWESGAVVGTQIIKGVPTGKTVTHTFMNSGLAQVTAKVRDKDMTDQEFAEAPEFTVNVDVVDAPAIALSPYNGSTIFNETDTGPSAGRINVELTVAPSGLEVGDSITVVLEVIRNGLNDGNLPVLSKYEVPFKNGQTAGYVYLSELDGTPQSELKGFRIRAYIKETTVCPVDNTKTWRQYYTSVDDFDIFVVNVDPVIGPGAAVSTNERPASINVPFTITWNAKDVSVDQQNMTVTWSYNGSSQTTTQNTSGTYSKEIMFTSAGSKVVTLMVQDKDGGTDTRSWYYKVEASMGLEITPRRPNSGALSAFSQKYTGAVGIGAGRVWSTSADYPTRVSNFTQSWDFQPANDLNPKIYAFGYKVDDQDNGGLGPAGSRDYALDAAGTWYNQASKYGSYYTYRNADGKDSYFYCWLVYDRDEGNSMHLNGTVQPQVGNGTGENSVTMPEYDEEATSYVKTMVEGIFSLEYFREDNVGDINQDGVPDVFAANTTWNAGRLFQQVEEGGELEEGGDLKDVSNLNVDADYLPAKTARGGTLVQTIQNWAKQGGPFTAYLEIRGFGEGLNLRQDNDGLNRNVRGNWISEPCFTPAESNAIARVNGLTLPDPEAEDYATQLTAWKAGLNAATSWIPENRTDPTVEDTDSDGFPDGYEYWFWYSAMVGEMDANGNIKRLEGSRFTLKDIATGERITPEEVAEAFNPTRKSIASATERDTDNDGLTDMEEYALGTSPINWDTDGDGLSDFWEVMHGLNPLKADAANNGTMNADGDFMAKYQSEPTWAVVTLDGQEYALPNNGEGFIDQETGAPIFINPETEEMQETGSFPAVKVFRYGKPGSEIVPKAYGDLPLSVRVWDDVTTNMVVTGFAKDQRITLFHDQVYKQFGFDPRTGWFRNDHGFVSNRWDPAYNKTQQTLFLQEAGLAVNTAPFTARDEYLLLKYRYEVGGVPRPDDEHPVYTIDGDTAEWNDKKQEKVFRLGTTNPNVPFGDAGAAAEEGAQATYASDIHGADTDQDGVPDGWELYVGQCPNSASTDYALLPFDSDGLGFSAEFAGTDSCNAYKECESIYANHPGINTGWYNKFFPTDPGDPDTDGDGLTDDQEGASWGGLWRLGNVASATYNFRFIYGPNANKPAEDADNGLTFCIRGGGLNPCSVDTDGDLLPDPWEHQFAGLVFANGRPVGVALDANAITVINRADRKATAAAGAEQADDDEALSAAQYITAGMDGTDPNDAFTAIGAVDSVTGTSRDFDFDHDGLQNFQEYLVQTQRQFRYDDSETPLMGSWMPDGPATSRKFVSFIQMNYLDGEAFYETCKQAGFAATGAWQFRELGYFARPPHEWDKTALYGSQVGLNMKYDDYGFRVMLMPQALTPMGRMPAGGYCSTDPRLWDTDGDGMDDFYELFHGLNPLLGSVQDGKIDGDVIAALYGGMVSHWYNGWTGFPDEAWPTNNGEPLFDVMAYPWMMGAPEADADGDGLRNISEALLVNMPSPQPTHTDPTPLWYTDSTSLNKASFTVQYYGTEQDFAQYPWSWSQGRQMALEGSTAADGALPPFMFSFEENEGYDTDNDRIPDAEERTMTADTVSDPLKFTDPDRRQALWFPGNESAAVSYSGNFHRPNGDQYDVLRQFTVEAWICPECLTNDQVILERACKYTSSTLSNNLSRVRANFRLGILADGRVYGCFDTPDAIPSGTGIGTPTVVGTVPEEGKWQHIALTYDGVELKLHQNGRVSAVTQTSLEPANGIVVFTQEAIPGMTNFPVLENGYKTLPCAFILGATALDEKGIALSKETQWEDYGKFYAGYIDEVRVWDGVRTLAQIQDASKRRLRFDDVSAQRDEVYAAWLAGATRNDNDGKAMLPAELLQHYNFQSLPGAVNATDVMWEPTGFTKNVFDNVRDMDGVLPAGTFECGWWSELPVHSTVYENYTWVPWIQNTCQHLPVMDGSTVDSRYWSEFFGGATMAKEVYNERNPNMNGDAYARSGEVKKIIFPNTSMPYTLYFYASEKAYHEDFLSYMALADASVQTNVNLYAFEIRTGFVGTSDLVPLGGAFAKRAEQMWDEDGAADAWTITADGDSAFSDVDANGIADWWQEYAIANYGAAEGFDWNSKVTWPDADGLEITAREAYLRDVARGMLPTDGGTVDATYASMRDDDKDGLPDWWESLKGISAETAYDDHDNDQLPNYAEYLIAEGFSNYGFPRVDPIKPNTFGQGVPDYFLRVGTLYLGEMFTDHDFMSDKWEDQWAPEYVSRGMWDALKDGDDDGWSNWAEYQAGTRPDLEALLGPEGSTLVEFPVPVVEAKVVYNGKKNFSSSIVVQAWSQDNSADKSMGGLPDASWTIPGPGAATAKVKQLGFNRDREITLSLGPGSVAAGSVSIGYWSNEEQFFEINDQGGITPVAHEPVWVPVVNDRNVLGSDEFGELLADGKVVGEINYITGRARIDLGDEVLHEITTIPVEENVYCSINLNYSYVRADWTTQKVDVGNGGTFYLSDSDANAVSGEEGGDDEKAKIQTKYGHLREGKTLFTAFADLDNNGAWTPGEPYGIAANVAVGWASASFSLELTDTAPQMARMDISAMTQAADFATATALTDRSEGINGAYYKNQSLYQAYKYMGPIGGDDNGGEEQQEDLSADNDGLPAATATTRVRVIRTAVNGDLEVNGISYNEVVLDRQINLGGHPTLTEADLVADGLLDLDWGTLEEAWKRTHAGSAITTPITNVTYRVVYGNGKDSYTTTQIGSSTVITDLDFAHTAAVAFRNAYEYGRTQTLCEPVAPKGTVQGATTTFQWKHEALDANGYKVKDYPAFRLQVLTKDGELVYDSGNQPAPSRNSLGVYSWEAPLYAGMVTKEGHLFSTTNNYTWQVSMLDAKFTEPNWTEPQEFRLEATGTNFDGRRYGTIAANVRYFGPIAESVSVDPSNTKNLIHVQAFTSGDFVGKPVAEGYVTDATNLTSVELDGVNAVTLALPAGTYYLAAYIDSNGNFERDPWESWGYVSAVGSADADVYKPVPVTITEPTAKVPSVNIFIEDTDVDNDGFPDAWEFTEFGTLDQQSSAEGATFFTKVNTGLQAAVESFDKLGLPQLSTGCAYEMPKLLSVLLGGGNEALAAAALASGAEFQTIKPDVAVSISSIGTAGLDLTVTSAQPMAKTQGTKLLAVKPNAVQTFDIYLLTAESLDGEWTASKVDQVTVPMNGTIEVKSEKIAQAVKEVQSKNAFFKIKLIEK